MDTRTTMSSKNTLSLPKGRKVPASPSIPRTTMNATPKAACFPSDNDAKSRTNNVQPPIPLIEAWLWMTVNKESEQIRREGRSRILQSFDSIEDAQIVVDESKNGAINASSLQKVPKTSDTSTPPDALVKTWMWMMTNKDDEELRLSGRQKLVDAFGGINAAVKFIEEMNERNGKK
jgi:hypothetical protein